MQKQADDLRDWGIIQQAEAQKFMEKYNNAVKRYHRLKAIAAVIAAAVGVMIGLQLMNLLPPPYKHSHALRWSWFVCYIGLAFFVADYCFFISTNK